MMNKNKKLVNTTCYQCQLNCPVKLVLDENGNIEKLYGPNCERCSSQIEFQYHKERLLNPLKRIGPRGKGQFVEVSWDEALDEISYHLKKLKHVYGAKSVVFYCGYTKEPRPYLERFAHVYGSPNYMTESSCCFSATWVAEHLTYGYRMLSNSHSYSKETKCLLVWSANPIESIIPYDNHHIMKKEEGRIVIVVDPRKTPAARMADLHLQIRPGTDGALALGLHNVIFSNEWENENFLTKWGQGVNEFKAYLKQYSPKRVAEICRIPEKDIIKAAHFYATLPPAKIVLSPTATTHHSNGFYNHRAIILLPAVTGNLDIRGGNQFFVEGIKLNDIGLFEETKNILPSRLGKQRFPIWTKYYPQAHAMVLGDAMLGKGEYSVKGLLGIGMNYMMFPNSKKFLSGIHNLEFFACSDFFHTQTTQWADIVLPSATSFEREALIGYSTCRNKGEMQFRNRVLCPKGQARSDGEIIIDLGIRMGFSKALWYKNFREALQNQLDDIGITLKELLNESEGVCVLNSEYLDGTPHPKEKFFEKYGFPTISGKIEFFSSELDKYGYESLPVYHEPFESPISTPEIAKKYPLILTTGGRSRFYTNSQHRNIRKLRKYDPKPRIEINVQDALDKGISNNDQVQVMTLRGKCIFYADVSNMVPPGVVHVFAGWTEANVNDLTCDINLDPISGYPSYKALLCNVIKVSK